VRVASGSAMEQLRLFTLAYTAVQIRNASLWRTVLSFPQITFLSLYNN
jgi:hypothetical protein